MRHAILQTSVVATLTALLLVAMSGCGLKGPLVHPDSPEARKTRRSTPPPATPAVPAPPSQADSPTGR